MHLSSFPNPCKDRILIVDDIPDNLELLARLLLRRGYEVQQATDGPSALASIPHFKPSLIVLDILMPEMNGYEVCHRLKANSHTREIPVVFVSALDETFDQVKAFEVGGADYITKPFRSKLIVARLENQLQIQRLRRQLHLQNQQLQQEVEERKKAEAVALQASQAKSEFLTNMSHEIRTPLNGVLGTADLLLRTSLNSDQQDLVQTLVTSAKSLLTIINDILDLSKLEAGKIQLNTTALDLRTCLHSAIALLAPQAREKELNLSTSFDSNIPSLLKGDPTRLRQILLNLIGNAIKFTESGSVKISVSHEPQDTRPEHQPNRELNSKLAFRKVAPYKTLLEGDKPPLNVISSKQASNSLSKLPVYVRFEVQDTGIGIAIENQKKLFQKFSQVDTSVTRRYGGSGLGLTICQRLVQLMGGEIGVSSTLGQGATFWFVVPFGHCPTNNTLPQTQTQKSPDLGESYPLEISLDSICKSKSESRRARLKVLIVDDAPVNRKVVLRQLHKLGHVAECAHHGQEALERLAKNNYDIVLMDCQMPVLDGYQATQAIRQQEQGIDRHQVVIGVTAHAMKGDREKCLAAGMDEYISKPVTLDDLNKVIQQCFLKQGSFLQSS